MRDSAAEPGLCAAGAPPVLRAVTGEHIQVHGARAATYQMDGKRYIKFPSWLRMRTYLYCLCPSCLNWEHTAVIVLSSSILWSDKHQTQWPVWAEGHRYLCPREEGYARKLYDLHFTDTY